MHVCCVQVRPVSCAKFDVDRTVNTMKTYDVQLIFDSMWRITIRYFDFWFLNIICTFAVISVDYVFAWTLGQ